MGWAKYFNPSNTTPNPKRAAVTMRNRNISMYAMTHICDDGVTTLCGVFVPPVVWEPGPQGELVYINTHPVDCKQCLAAANIGAWA